MHRCKKVEEHRQAGLRAGTKEAGALPRVGGAEWQESISVPLVGC